MNYDRNAMPRQVGQTPNISAMHLLGGRPASRTLGRHTTRLQPHLDRTRDTAKADKLDFGNIRDQRSLTHRRGTEIARATSVLRLNAIAGKNHQMCARTTEEERLRLLRDHLQDLKVSLNQFSTQVSVLRPFYPEDLFEELSQCRKAAWMEIDQVIAAGKNTFSASWYAQGEKNQDDFSAHYLEAGRIIRNRLDQLSVVPS